MYLITVPSGLSSGMESSRSKDSEVTLPGTLKMGSPRISLQTEPQLDLPGVGTD